MINDKDITIRDYLLYEIDIDGAIKIKLSAPIDFKP